MRIVEGSEENGGMGVSPDRVMRFTDRSGYAVNHRRLVYCIADAELLKASSEIDTESAWLIHTQTLFGPAITVEACSAFIPDVIDK